MFQKIVLNSSTLAELRNIAISIGEKPYRAEQIYRWLYSDKAVSIDDFTNLSLTLREALAGISEIVTLREAGRLLSKDGSIKFAFDLHDGERIESVLLAVGSGYSGCLSSQVGCRMGCKFCATASLGFKRNLTAAEILEQVRLLEKEAGGKLAGLVFMGMGEPTDNLSALLKALEILTDDKGYGYSRRKITVSTAGNIPALSKLFETDNPVNLAVSLNAADDELRCDIMPISKKYPLPALIKALKALPVEKRRRITIEYVLLGGVNDSDGEAKKLLKLLKGLPIKVNLIRYNDGSGLRYKRPVESAVLSFQKTLTDAKMTAFIRKSVGSDIAGACGQLALAKYPS